MPDKRKKILIIEEDKALSKIYRTKFFQQGFKTRWSPCGNRALLIIDEFQPDLIILDIILPNHDGWTTLQKIKKNPHLKKIPLVVVSNFDRPEHIKRAKGMGAIAYFVKISTPVNKLTKEIERLLAVDNSLIN